MTTSTTTRPTGAQPGRLAGRVAVGLLVAVAAVWGMSFAVVKEDRDGGGARPGWSDCAS